jgi:hypothetical protein
MTAIERRRVAPAETETTADSKRAAAGEFIAEHLGVLRLPGISDMRYEIGDPEIAAIEDTLTRRGLLGPAERLDDVYPGILDEVTPIANPGRPIIHPEVKKSGPEMAKVIELRPADNHRPAA